MNKPASVAIKEFEINMEKCINESGLPPIVVEMIMRGYYIQIKEMAKDKRKRKRKPLKEG